MAWATRLSCLLTFLCSILFAVYPVTEAAGGSIDGEKALYTLAKSRLQGTYTQKFTMEFLLVAYGIDKANNRAGMVSSIDAFDARLNDFMAGNSANKIIEPPNTVIENTLAEIKSKWDVYKALLLSNVDTVTKESDSILLQVEELNEEIMEKCDLLVDEYAGYARANGVTLPSQSVVLSGRQRSYLKKMCKEAIFVGLDVNKTLYLQKMQNTITDFETSHDGLVRGVDFLDLQPLTEVCTLNQMMHVTEYWIVLRKDLQTILDNGAASEYDLSHAAEAIVKLDQEMEKAVTLYSATTFDCPVIETEPTASGWQNVIGQVGLQKTLGEKAARLFLQVALGVSVESSLMALGTTLTEASSTLRLIIEGSTSQNVPSPPSQGIADDLIISWADFSEMEALARENMLSMDFSPFSLSKMAATSAKLLDHTTDAAKQYMKIDEVKNTADIRAFVLQEVFMQRMRIEKMVKEAVLAASGIDVTANVYAALNTSADFRSAHDYLLSGSASLGFPRTTDACTLTLMMDLLDRFNELDVLVQQVLGGTLKGAQLVSTVANIDSLASTATSILQSAFEFYKAGSGTCNTQLHTRLWEEGVSQAVKAPSYFQSAQKNFILAASGYAEIWAAQAESALSDHEGYIANDAQSTTIVDAFLAFISSWNDYAANDEERMTGLQKQYILDNPHPFGSKDMLDYAPGPEQYHVDHKKYHPIYRARLYERNYYDIFFFDLNGNCIYTVYKELDYATPFDLNSNGEWKTSGLGEAYRAARAAPDKVSVIDWKPYGPSGGALASFLSIGIKNSAGQLVGILSTQMPPESKPIDAPGLLTEDIKKIDNKLKHLMFGVSEDDVPPPPSQRIANQLFKVSDDWEPIKTLLEGSTDSVETLTAILAADAGYTAETSKFIEIFLEEAFANAPTVQGKKIAVASEQKMLVQKMLKEVFLIAMKHSSASATRLKDTIKIFEDNHQLLLHGNLANSTERRLQQALSSMNDIPPSTENAIVRTLGDVGSDFTGLQELLVAVADGGETTEQAMRAIVDGGDGVISKSDSAYKFFSTVTRSTTTISIDILAPMPLTGEWNAGRTMRIAALIAQGLINEGQNILPGYSLNTVILDDKCDSQESVQIVLREMATSDNYIALGGSGCSEVCMGTAFVASSMRLPYLSYECADSDLADTAQYPDFTRFGTVTSPMAKGMAELGNKFMWDHITIISGDPSKYRPKAEALQEELIDFGFTTEYVFAYDTEWDQIVGMMDLLRLSKRRVFFVIGTETYFRKVICASIVVKANLGITWLSEGTWRHEWYKKSDMIIQSHIEWIAEDASTQILKDAFNAFKPAWDAFAQTHEERMAGLQLAYITENPNPLGSKDTLDYAPGDAAYHVAHKTYHPFYRKQLYERNYYDIFIFDLQGNLIYTVYKELDYATNLQNGEWKDSGLGDAFRAALQAPDEVTQIPWSPYGPSAGALASFLATGIKDETGQLIGVFSTQMPPEAKSIDTVEPDCSLEAIAGAYEGAINFVGLGLPLAQDMDRPLPCFAGHTTTTFMALIDQHLVDGYPTGNSNKVADPFHDVKMHAADGACVFAYTVKYLLDDQGYTIDQIRRPDAEIYNKFLQYIKTQIDFIGASGQVKFAGNDKPGYIGVQQIIGGTRELRGTITSNSSIDFSLNDGPSNESWQPAYPDPPPPPSTFPYLAFQVCIPLLCICCPALAGCIRSA